MFLSLDGHRLVSRFLGQALVLNITLNLKLRLKSVQWNKAGAVPV